MNFKRILRHTLASLYTHELLDSRSIQEVASATTQAELGHCGEIRFSLVRSLSLSELLANTTPRQKALELFSTLKIWDTELNNGVLLFLLLADCNIEIIADRGINKAVGERRWQEICLEIEEMFREGKFIAGVKHGLELISTELKRVFPMEEIDQNQLPDDPDIQ